jgi:hypothetical protein
MDAGSSAFRFSAVCTIATSVARLEPDEASPVTSSLPNATDPVEARPSPAQSAHQTCASIARNHRTDPQATPQVPVGMFKAQHDADQSFASPIEAAIEF